MREREGQHAADPADQKQEQQMQRAELLSQREAHTPVVLHTYH